MDKKFKIFVIIAIVLLGVTIAISAFVVLNMVNKGDNLTENSKEVKSKLITIDLGDAITSNIYDETGEQHIIRVSISFGVNESSKQYKQFKKDFDTSKVIIRNEIIQGIREQTYEMMSKTDAQTKLGDEIAARLNKLLNTEVVEEVYFSDFFVQ